MSLDQALYEKHPIPSCLHLLDCLIKDIFLANSPHKYLYFACLSILMIFSIIPPGSLKPYFNVPAGAIFIVALLCLSQSFYIRGLKHFSPDIYQTLDGAEHFGISRFNIGFIAVVSCLSLYSVARGMPGNIFGLSGLTAMPLWSVVGGWGIFGLICFFTLLAVGSPWNTSNSVAVCSRPAILSVYSAVRASAGPALTAAIFLPWNPGVSLGLSGVAMFALDFVFFWLKVSLLQIFIFPAVRKGYLRIETKVPANIRYMARIPLVAAGAAAFLLDYIFA